MTLHSLSDSTFTYFLLTKSGLNDVSASANNMKYDNVAFFSL